MELLEEKENSEMARRWARRGKRGKPPKALAEGQGAGRSFLAVGILVFALAAFVSGAWVGKALSDLRHRDGFSSGARAGGSEAKPPFRPLAKTDSPSGQEAKVAVPSSSPPAAESKTSDKLVAEEKSGLPPAAGQEEGRAAPPQKAKFSLQIGAFNNADEAQEVMKRFRAKGYDAFQITSKAGAAKGTLARVRIGHFPSLQEARQFAQEFEKKEKIKTIITSLE